MHDTDLNNHIPKAANGDDFARERLIRHYQPYIINVVGHICRKYITWSDEEASIGLLAFNRAIDTYDVQSRKTFLSKKFTLQQPKKKIDDIEQKKKENHVKTDKAEPAFCQKQ